MNPFIPPAAAARLDDLRREARTNRKSVRASRQPGDVQDSNPTIQRTTGDLDALVRAAAAGDQRAWGLVIARFGPLVRATARRHRLGHADQEEVLQRTWLALVRQIDRVNKPAALGGWLVTTARNESVQLLRDAQREVPTADIEVNERTADDDAPAAAERRVALRKAVEAVPGRQRALLQMLLTEPEPSYEQVSARLGMPVGSIGPTRARCIERLRRDPHIAGLLAESFRPLMTTRTPGPACNDQI